MGSMASSAIAQTTDAKRDTTITSQSFSPDLSFYYDQYVLYVLKSNTQTEEILISTTDDISKLLDQDDIESVNIFKGELAINEYGTRAKNGAIVIHFKKEFKKLPKDLNDKLVREGN